MGPKPWRARKVREWITLDLIASYTFNLPPPASGAVPGLAKDGGKNIRMKEGEAKNVMPVSTARVQPVWMAGLVKWHDADVGDAKCIRFRSAVCGRLP